MDVSSFSQWLRQRRKAAGLTQAELADRVGCATVTIKKIETGQRRPSQQICERIAALLGAPPPERTDAPPLAALPPLEAPSPIALAQAALSAPPALPARAPLPVALTPLIGRMHDASDALALLLSGEVRLLTLIGPPGVGKTRLAMHLAHAARASFADGAAFVRLAPLSDPELVLSAIARALGLTEHPQQPAGELLQQVLATRELLIVLDNFEHLLPAAPAVVELLMAAPGLKLLTTSQERLHVYGEHLFRVSPLALPDPASYKEPAALAGAPAVALFVARARAARHDFALTDANAAAVAELCVFLDGMPLAIELAAAQSAVYSPAALLEQIGSRLHQLAPGPRDVPARQQTLRGAITWSYQLLTQEERRVFRCLGVFTGGWMLEAAEAVCDAPPAAGQISVAETLHALADKSMIRAEQSDEGPLRFSMLQTIRAFAVEQLEAQRELAAARRRHAAYYVALAEAAAPELNGDTQARWLNRLEQEHPNLRVALQTALEQGEPALALQMIGALWMFWRLHSHQHEARRWMDSVLGRTTGQPTLLRARVLLGAGWLAYDYSDNIRAAELFAESLALFREHDDSRGIALALHGLGEMAQLQSDYARAEQAFAESLARFRALDDREEIAWSLDHLGRLSLYQGRYTEATVQLQEALDLFRASGQRWGVAYALINLGIAALSQADVAAARPLFTESLARQQEIGDQKGVAISLYHLGDVAYYSDDLEAAGNWFEESLRTSRQFSYPWCTAMALEGLGRVAVRRGAHELAAQAFGECLALLQSQNTPPGRIVAVLEGVVSLLVAQSRPDCARSFAEAAATLREQLGMPQSPVERAAYAPVLASLPGASVARGATPAAITVEEAVAAARHTLAAPQ